jgi:uncharacterized protein (TIGR02302 family)
LPSAPDPGTRLDRLRRAAALTLLWEDLWPPLAFAGVVVVLFVAASWFGLWFATPPLLRLVALAAFALALLAALFPLVRLRWSSRARALERLDRDAPAAHRPASSLEDALANPEDDPATRALWALHKQRLAGEVERLALKAPSPNMPARDPYALRFAAILLALVGFFAAGSERFARLAAAFYGMPTIAHAASARVDAWIDPPAYTSKPPIFLKLGEADAVKSVTAPEGSALVVRADPKAVTVTVTGGLAAAPAVNGPERRFALNGDGEAKIYDGGSLTADLVLKAAPKTAPSIRLLDPPQGNLSGSLTLHYAIDDAYGVREAGGAVALATPDAKPAHRLFEPPTLALSLPGGANGVGEGRTTVDLSENPWAGARVNLTLTAKSVSEATATSPAVEMTLPQRRFVNPLAKALVELRRDLVLDPDRNQPRVGRALAALTIGPDLFDTSPRVYLDLQGAGSLLAKARSDDDLREVAAWLWRLALSIENGDASQALKDLRSAEDKLREALKKGASPEELKKLTQELRDAAERYLSEMMKDDKQSAQDDDAMDSKDLESMLDKLEKDAGAGDKEQAQAMLDEMQDMMENLRSADGDKPDPAAKQMRQSLKDLDKLLKDQQALRDDTFRQDQRERSGSPPGDQDKSSPSLEKRQRELRDRLGQAQKQLRGSGAEPPKNLDEAEGDMSEAEQNLKDDGQGEGQGEGEGKSKRRYGHSPKGDAVEAQGKAIEALRQGGEAMQQQMRGKGKGGKGYVGRAGKGQGEKGDPLGRGQEGRKGAAEGQLSGGPDRAERARRVLEELRRRLSDPNRPSEERDYLERLIGQP